MDIKTLFRLQIWEVLPQRHIIITSAYNQYGSPTLQCPKTLKKNILVNLFFPYN